MHHPLGDSIHNLMVKDDYAGVRHFQLVDQIADKLGTWHVFAKRSQGLPCSKKWELCIQGHLFFEISAQLGEKIGNTPYVSIPEATASNFSILTDDCRTSVQVYRGPHTVPMHMIIHLENKCEECWLKINHNKKRISLSSLLSKSNDSINAVEKQQIAHVLIPPRNIPINLYEVLLDRHMRFHRNLGVEQVILYIRPGFMLNAMLECRSPLICHYVQQRLIIIVLWDILSFPEGSEHLKSYHDQHIIYNHALLSLSNLKRYVLLVDLDEYVILPSGTSLLQEMDYGHLSGCIPRYNVMLDDKAKQQCNHNSFEGEIKLWRSCKEFKMVWYSLLSPKKLLPKCLLRPSNSWGFRVHGGQHFYIKEDGQFEKQGVFIAHLINLLRKREDDNNSADYHSKQMFDSDR